MTVDDFPLYRFRARFVRAIDGDTAELAVDCGFHVTRTIRVRLAGINAPEIHGTYQGAAIISAMALTDLLRERTLYVATNKDRRSFDRWVASILVEGAGGELLDVADQLVDAGHAVRVT